MDADPAPCILPSDTQSSCDVKTPRGTSQENGRTAPRPTGIGRAPRSRRCQFRAPGETVIASRRRKLRSFRGTRVLLAAFPFRRTRRHRPKLSSCLLPGSERNYVGDLVSRKDRQIGLHSSLSATSLTGHRAPPGCRIPFASPAPRESCHPLRVRVDASAGRLRRPAFDVLDFDGGALSVGGVSLPVDGLLELGRRSGLEVGLACGERATQETEAAWHRVPP